MEGGKSKSKSPKKLHFSKKEAISFGFDIAKKNISFFLSLLVVIVLVYIGLSILQDISGAKTYFLPSLIYGILFWLVNVIISMGIIRISLEFVDGKKPKTSDVFYTRSIINYILVSIIRSIVVFAGFILLIIPGIILSIKLQFAEYLVVDKNMDFMDALKKSWKMTKGVKWNLFLLGLLLVLINIAGLLALFIGLVITVPLSMVATAFVYRKLLSQV